MPIQEPLSELFAFQLQCFVFSQTSGTKKHTKNLIVCLAITQDWIAGEFNSVPAARMESGSNGGTWKNLPPMVISPMLIWLEPKGVPA